MTAFTEREFRNALGHFATGVVIATAEVNGHRIGATMSSFNTVSLNPPLILFSIARSAHGLAAWQAAKHYGISVLAARQTDLSNRFAKSQSDKWDGLRAAYMENGAPLLPDWLAYFECTPYARHDGGDHEIFVGRVTRFVTQTSALSPLLFFQGKYRHLESDVPISPPLDAEIWPHAW